MKIALYTLILLALTSTFASPAQAKTALAVPAHLDPLFTQYGDQYSVPKATLVKISRCESRFNPQAVSPRGTYVGLFQFAARTWRSQRRALGLDPNPALRANAAESIRTAAFMISRQGTSAWPVCSKKV